MTNIEQQALELKPCPFCGGPAQIWHQKKNHREQTYVLCNEALCGTSKSGVGGKRADREADAIASWNRRALTPTGENAKHVEELTRMRDFARYVRETRGEEAMLGEQALDAAIRALSAPDNAEVADAVPNEDASLDAVIRHHLFVYEVDFGDEGKGRYVRLADFNKVVANYDAARVSGQDIDWCEDIARDVLDSTDAAAIRRLVQAVKGEG